MDEASRDLNADLVEITTRLGEPDAVYQSNSRSMLWRFLIGVLLVVVAAVIHYLVWTGGMPAFKIRHFKLWLLLILGMFVGPGAGLYLIFFAVRGLKMAVLEYPSGLFVWHRGVVVALPWNEIQQVTFKGLPAASTFETTATTQPTTGHFDLQRSTRRLFGTTLTLTREDGNEVALSSILNGFPTLGEQVQRRTFEVLFPEVWERFTANEGVAFGPFLCQPQELTYGNATIPWSELASVERVAEKLVFQLKPKGKVWNKCDIDKVPNLHLFLALARHAIGAPNVEEE